MAKKYFIDKRVFKSGKSNPFLNTAATIDFQDIIDNYGLVTNATLNIRTVTSVVFNSPDLTVNYSDGTDDTVDLSPLMTTDTYLNLISLDTTNQLIVFQLEDDQGNIINQINLDINDILNNTVTGATNGLSLINNADILSTGFNPTADFKVELGGQLNKNTTIDTNSRHITFNDSSGLNLSDFTISEINKFELGSKNYEALVTMDYKIEATNRYSLVTSNADVSISAGTDLELSAGQGIAALAGSHGILINTDSNSATRTNAIPSSNILQIQEESTFPLNTASGQSLITQDNLGRVKYEKVTDISKVLFVDENAPTSTVGQKGNLNRPYTSIASAMVDAEKGDLIYLFPGQYNTEPISNTATVDQDFYHLKLGVSIYGEEGAELTLRLDTTEELIEYDDNGMSIIDQINILGDLTLIFDRLNSNVIGIKNLFIDSSVLDEYAFNIDVKTILLKNELKINCTNSEAHPINIKAKTLILTHALDQFMGRINVNKFAYVDSNSRVNLEFDTLIRKQIPIQDATLPYILRVSAASTVNVNINKCIIESANSTDDINAYFAFASTNNSNYNMVINEVFQHTERTEWNNHFLISVSQGSEDKSNVNIKVNSGSICCIPLRAGGLVGQSNGTIHELHKAVNVDLNLIIRDHANTDNPSPIEPHKALINVFNFFNSSATGSSKTVLNLNLNIKSFNPERYVLYIRDCSTRHVRVRGNVYLNAAEATPISPIYLVNMVSGFLTGTPDLGVELLDFTYKVNDDLTNFSTVNYIGRDPSSTAGYILTVARNNCFTSFGTFNAVTDPAVISLTNYLTAI